MDYSGPVAADYRNVKALNRAFLSLLRSSAAGAPWRDLLSAPADEQIRALTDLQLERLAECPLLLFSFHETDDAHWRKLLEDDPSGDLLREPLPPALERIMTSGLAFLWQLAQRSPYTVRLIAGGGAGFCERLNEVTIVRLLRSAACHGDVVVPRFTGDPATWVRLLGPGISPTARVRRAAQLAVLQAMLTTAVPESRERLRAAACVAPVPFAGITGKPARP